MDLRFRSQSDFRIETDITAESLIVRFFSNGKMQKETAPSKELLVLPAVPHHEADPNSCMSCGVKDCFGYVQPSQPIEGRTAYLVDEYWPEFDAYLQSRKTEHDILCLPIEGRKFHKPNYAWSTEGYARLTTAHAFTALRSIESRQLADQGAARQTALLYQYAKLAKIYAKSLDYDVEHLVVTQSLLPFLFMDGVLCGRTFDVLMTANGAPAPTTGRRMCIAPGATVELQLG